MSEEEITALARELANDLYNDDKPYNSILWWSEELKERKAEELKHALRFLLRRLCLVEKEDIEKYFQSRNYILSHQDKYEVYIVRESEVEMKLLRCLFPEIAKEVEDA